MPDQHPTLATAAGTTLSVSVTHPANHDQAGFDGISDWTEVGYVVNTGGFPKAVREYGDVSLLSGVTLVIPQNETMEDLEVETVFQWDDAGQTIIRNNANGMTILSFKWELPSGFKVYACCYVTGYGPSAETSEDYVASTFTLKPLFDIYKVGAVYSAPALIP